MFKAISQLFAMFFRLFSAGEKLAASVENLASIAEDESVGLRERLAVEREARIKALSRTLTKVA